MRRSAAQQYSTWQLPTYHKQTLLVKGARDAISGANVALRFQPEPGAGGGTQGLIRIYIPMMRMIDHDDVGPWGESLLYRTVGM